MPFINRCGGGANAKEVIGAPSSYATVKSDRVLTFKSPWASEGTAADLEMLRKVTGLTIVSCSPASYTGDKTGIIFSDFNAEFVEESTKKYFKLNGFAHMCNGYADGTYTPFKRGSSKDGISVNSNGALYDGENMSFTVTLNDYSVDREDGYAAELITDGYYYVYFKYHE